MVAAWVPISRAALFTSDPLSTPKSGEVQGLTSQRFGGAMRAPARSRTVAAGEVRRGCCCVQTTGGRRRALAQELAQTYPPTATAPPTASAARVGVEGRLRLRRPTG